MCGAAASTRATQLVPDVHAFPGHIACASSTQSEVVVPVLAADGRLLAVLDLDSGELKRGCSSNEPALLPCMHACSHALTPTPALLSADLPAAFTATDAACLETLCASLGARRWETGLL